MLDVKQHQAKGRSSNFREGVQTYTKQNLFNLPYPPSVNTLKINFYRLLPSSYMQTKKLNSRIKQTIEPQVWREVRNPPPRICYWWGHWLGRSGSWSKIPAEMVEAIHVHIFFLFSFNYLYKYIANTLVHNVQAAKWSGQKTYTRHLDAQSQIAHFFHETPCYPHSSSVGNKIKQSKTDKKS